MNKEYQNKCFSPNWLEVDLEKAKEQDVIREVRSEQKQRKDLDTLLKELEEIRQNIELVAEKQHMLTNLMGFYSGKFAQ